MLRSELIKPRMAIAGDRLSPQILEANYYWLGVAADIRRIFLTHLGRRRGQLHQALRAYENDSLDYPIMRGLAAVLESGSEFAQTPAVDPVALRAALFAVGPVTARGDLLQPKSREMHLSDAAAAYGVTPQQVEEALFADLADEQILQSCGEPLTPLGLIERYNIEVARGLLYWAREVRIRVHDGYKDVFKFIKLFKLMHQIAPADGGGYNITLFGPISPFVKSTIRYGVQFAKFMPALLLCERWQMVADVQAPQVGRVLKYRLDDSTPLKTHFKGSGSYDSRLEADFAVEFEEKLGRSERVWQLSREDQLVVVGDSVMIPDFAFTHRKDGRRALVEIVGFWHKDYLKRKLRKIRDADLPNLIVLIYESANVADGAFEAAGANVVTFKRKPVIKDVLAAVERVAVGP